MSSDTCVFHEENFAKKKIEGLVGERQERNFGCVDHGQGESTAQGHRRLHRATEGYTGPQRGRTNQARAIAESNPRPRTYPPLNLGVHDLFNLPTN